MALLGLRGKREEGGLLSCVVVREAVAAPGKHNDNARAKLVFYDTDNSEKRYSSVTNSDAHSAPSCPES